MFYLILVLLMTMFWISFPIGLLLNYGFDFLNKKKQKSDKKVEKA